MLRAALSAVQNRRDVLLQCAIDELAHLIHSRDHSRVSAAIGRYSGFPLISGSQEMWALRKVERVLKKKTEGDSASVGALASDSAVQLNLETTRQRMISGLLQKIDALLQSVDVAVIDQALDSGVREVESLLKSPTQSKELQRLRQLRQVRPMPYSACISKQGQRLAQITLTVSPRIVCRVSSPVANASGRRDFKSSHQGPRY